MIENSLSFITAAAGLIMSMVILGVLYKRKQKNSNVIHLVAYQSLGSKKGVAALQVGKEILVVGIMPNGFRVLKTLEAKEVMEKKEELYAGRIEKLRKLKEDVDE